MITSPDRTAPAARDRTADLHAHERRAIEMIAGISAKIVRLEQARTDRQAALKRIRTALAEATLAQRGPADHDS